MANNKLIVQHRRGTAEQWESSGIVPYDGEIVIEECADGTFKTKIGDGVNTFPNLPYQNLDKEIAELKQYVDGKVVDGLLYEDNKLYLTLGGEVVSEPVEIAGGSGGAGGATYIVTLQNLMESRYITVSEGSEVNIKFSYSSVDADDINDGEGVGTLYVNNISVATMVIAQGENSLDITQYLKSGENAIKLRVANSEGSSRMLTYSVSVISLSVSTTFNELDSYSGNVTFMYVVTGSGLKTIHFVMDGVEIGTTETTATGRSLGYTIPAQSHGSHIFEVYATSSVNEVTVKSNIVKLGMLWIGDSMLPAIISTFTTTSAIQGEVLTVPYMVYDPTSENAAVMLSVIKEDGAAYSVKNLTVDRTAQNWTVQDFPTGNITLKIICGSVSVSFPINVQKSTFTLEPISDGLTLEFSAEGRSNNEQNPESWSYNNMVALFDGFGWAGADGWLDDSNGATMLRFLPGDTMTIPLKIFEDDCRSTGLTIEVEMATRDVRDYESVVISCMSNERGFKVASQYAELKSEGSNVSMQFKEDSRVRVTFIVEHRNLNRLIYIYINGILCGATQYPEADNFSQSPAVGITIGAESCGIDLYRIRCYKKGLTRYEELNNYICDRPTLADRIEAQKRNDILDESEEVSIAKLPMDLPYMIISCPELPQYKGDKKQCTIEYVNRIDPSKSFTASGVQINVQGTSSAGYRKKNFKISYKKGFDMTESGEHVDGYKLRDTSIPAKVFTMKADVASSENANNVKLVDYYNTLCPYKTPPQVADSRVRQGVDGIPIVIFWENTGATPSVTRFEGKYNANDDKSSVEVFGLTEGCESWEFRNNTSNRMLFKVSDYGDGWLNDFEARYPEDNIDFTNLKRMTDWVVSTDREQATDGVLETPVIYNGIQYTTDSSDYRLAKFKTEFEDYFIKDAMIFYYLFTEIFLMVDSRAKNFFASTFDGIHWMPLPYDYDTALGINNEGVLAFSYDLEDTDTVGGENVFNGQTSVLWCNIRDVFGNDIKKMYQDLRSEGYLSYEVLRDIYIKHQSAWPEALWNEDAYEKYLQPLIINNDKTYLPMIQGDKSSQRDWWLFNGFRYRDSKYYCGDALKNVITLRCYATGDITVTPYSNIWPTIKYGSYLVAQRGERNIPYTLKCPLDEMNDTEVYIYSADRIGNIGDLSGLKVGFADFSMAVKLQSLILGSNVDGYENTRLETVNVGNNELLTLINVENCTSLTQTVDLSGCTGLETVKAKGSAVTGLSLPNGGHLKTLELPATITNFTVQNQQQLESVTFEGYGALTTLRVENSTNIPIEAIFDNAINLNRVRLMNVEWTASSSDELAKTINKLKTCIGMDANGNNTKTAIVNGRVRVPAVDDALLADIGTNFPDLIVVVGDVACYIVRYINADGTLLYTTHMTEGSEPIDPVAKGLISTPTREGTGDIQYTYNGWSNMPATITGNTAIIASYKETYLVVFLNYDGSLLDSQWIDNGEDAEDPVTNNIIEKPTRPQTVQYNYVYIGWDKNLTNITAPIDITAQYDAIIRSYTVRFLNNDKVLETQTVEYGQAATYTGQTPIKLDVDNPDDYVFTGWTPNPSYIEGDLDCYASFKFTGYIEDSWVEIVDSIVDGTYATKYKVNRLKETTLTYSDGTSDTIDIELVDFNHDDLADGSGKASISWIVKEVPSKLVTANQSVTNVGGWEGSALRTHVKNIIYNALPDDLKAIVKPVIKKASAGAKSTEIIESTDSVWIPAIVEIDGTYTNATTYPVYAQEGSTYAAYTSKNKRIKYNSTGESYVNYWTRSADVGSVNSFHCVYNNGAISSFGADFPMGVAFGFCI